MSCTFSLSYEVPCAFKGLVFDDRRNVSQFCALLFCENAAQNALWKKFRALLFCEILKWLINNFKDNERYFPKNSEESYEKVTVDFTDFSKFPLTGAA